MQPIDPGDDVPSGTTSRDALIVAAQKQDYLGLPSDELWQHRRPPLPTMMNADWVKVLKDMSFSLHTIKESLPSVLPGHVVTPSTASRDRQRSSSIFDAVGLALKPTEVEGEYVLSVEQQRKTEWNFSFNWPRQTGDDKVLEKTSYAPVLDFLRGLGLLAEDVSEGANCVEKRCTILISSHAGKKIQSKCEDSESIIDIVCKAVPILSSTKKRNPP